MSIEIIRLEVRLIWDGELPPKEGFQNASFAAMYMSPEHLTHIATVYQAGYGIPEKIEIYKSAGHYYSTVESNSLMPLPIQIDFKNKGILINLTGWMAEGYFRDYAPVNMGAPIADFLDKRILLSCDGELILYKHDIKPHLQIFLDSRPKALNPGNYLTLCFCAGTAIPPNGKIISQWAFEETTQAISSFESEVENYKPQNELPLISQQTIMNVIVYPLDVLQSSNSVPANFSQNIAKLSETPRVNPSNNLKIGTPKPITDNLPNKGKRNLAIFIIIFAAYISLHLIAIHFDKSPEFKVYDPARTERINRKIEQAEIRSNFNLSDEEISDIVENEVNLP